MVLVAISFLCLLRVYAAGADERKLLYRRQFAPQQAGSASVIGQSASGPEGQGAKPLPGMKIHKESPTTTMTTTPTLTHSIEVSCRYNDEDRPTEHSPIVLGTHFVSAAMLLNGNEAGATAFLMKDLNFSDLPETRGTD